MMRVAIQGERGSFSDEAAQAALGPDLVTIPCREFRDVGAALRDGVTDYAVLPVENSIAGSVLPAYDVLAATTVPVIAEITRPIRHCVLGVAGARLSDVRRVLSHPVALAQCGKFFLAHPDIEAVAAYDTGGAAKEISELGAVSVAAIASRTAAALYGLQVLASDVQDRDDNQTRFYVLGTRPVDWRMPTDTSKTALLVETANQPGALLAVLEPLARERVNLSKLEARPGETPWTYRFFLEFEGALTDERVARAVHAMQQAAARVQVLGSFVVLEAAG